MTEEYKRIKSKGEGIDSFCRLSIVFFLISFIGWCFEKMGRYLLYGSTGDRGFLSLPFCVIYGFCTVTVYFLIGTPRKPKRFLRCFGKLKLTRIVMCVAGIAAYFFATVIISTLAELLVGGFFYSSLGIRLWNYSAMPYNYKGFICIQYSILWGTLMTLFMLFLWDRFVSLVSHLEDRSARTISFALLLCTSIDLLFNVIHLIKMGSHFNFL